MADVTKNDELIDDNLNKIDSETDTERENNDSEEILMKDFIEEPAPKYNIDLFGFKYKLDKSTVHTFVPAMIIYIASFFLLGLQNECTEVKIAFVMSIVLWLVQIHDRRNENVQHISGEAAARREARDSAIVILSIVSLFTVLWRQKSSPILGVGILVLIVGSFWYTHQDIPLHYRFARNVSVASLNTALMMFGLFIVKHYICSGNRPVVIGGRRRRGKNN